MFQTFIKNWVILGIRHYVTCSLISGNVVFCYILYVIQYAWLFFAKRKSFRARKGSRRPKGDQSLTRGRTQTILLIGILLTFCKIKSLSLTFQLLIIGFKIHQQVEQNNKEYSLNENNLLDSISKCLGLKTYQ